MTAYSATALLLPPGTLATGMPSRVSAAWSSRSTPAPVTWTSLSAVPSNSSGASFGPTAGITSASLAFISAATCASAGAW